MYRLRIEFGEKITRPEAAYNARSRVTAAAYDDDASGRRGFRKSSGFYLFLPLHNNESVYTIRTGGYTRLFICTCTTHNSMFCIFVRGNKIYKRAVMWCSLSNKTYHIKLHIGTHTCAYINICIYISHILLDYLRF